MVNESAYEDAVGYPGRLDHLCSVQGHLDALQVAGEIVEEGVAWDWGANSALVSRVWNPRRFRSTHAYVMNGNVVAGNIDIGVYTIHGERIASTGATAQAGTSQTQFVALVATIPAGPLLLALSTNNATGKYAHASISAAFAPTQTLSVFGWGVDAAGAHPLPDPLVPDTGFANEERPPIFGVLKRWPS